MSDVSNSAEDHPPTESVASADLAPEGGSIDWGPTKYDGKWTCAFRVTGARDTVVFEYDIGRGGSQ